MTQEDHERARMIVEAFRDGLSDNVQTEIGNAAFGNLVMMILQAIQEDRKHTANLVEEVVKTLRKDVDIPELGM